MALPYTGMGIVTNPTQRHRGYTLTLSVYVELTIYGVEGISFGFTDHSGDVR